MLALGVYLAFAGASISWAYSPESSLKAYILHLMVISCVVLPYALPVPMERTLRRLSAACAVTVLVNLVVISTTPPSPIGHYGIYDHKQQLGMFVSLAIILFTADLFRGSQALRLRAALFIGLGFWVMLASQSKGNLAFLFLAPMLATGLVAGQKLTRVSPAIYLAAIPIIYTLLGIETEAAVSREAYRFYGDYTVTARTDIWSFIHQQIARAPWLGWGFHSYWNVPYPPNAAAPGFVKDMISSHSGYIDLRLETGAVGHAIFLVFIYTALRGAVRAQRYSFVTGALLLTLGVYTMLLNLFESIWISLTPNWLAYLIVVAELNRYAQGVHVGVNRAVPVRRAVRVGPRPRGAGEFTSRPA
jgi:O-antigen ligase